MLCKTKTYYNKDLKIWSGENVTSIYNPNISVGQVILSSFRKNPYNIAQINDNNGLKFTNEEMEIRSVRVIKNLLKLNYKKGDVIGIVSSNNDKIGAIAIAALTIGMPLSSLDPYFFKNEIKHMFMITKPKLIVCEHFNYKIVQEVCNEIDRNTKIFVIGSADETYHKSSSVQSVDILFEKCDESDDHFYIPTDIEDGENTVAALMCTSGTTGPPKGICLSHSILLRNFIPFHPYITSDIVLSFSTLYWISGLVSLIAASITGCTRILTTETFTAELCLRMIEKYKVSFLMTSPFQLSTLVQLGSNTIKNYNLSSVKLYLFAGSKLNTDNCMEIQKYMNDAEICNAYGLSEFGMVSNGIGTKNKSKINSVGMVSENVLIKILNKKMEQIGINEIGEICVKLKNYKFLGYCNNTNNNTNNENQNKNIIDDDKWIHTGDLGYFDDDGYLYIIGRNKELLKYKNYQISPSEIEDVVYRMSSDIVNVCVIGIPDNIGNDLPAAVIIKKCDSDINEKEIYDYVEENISNYKLLRGGVYFVNEFPLTPSGKIKRKALQEYVIKNCQLQIKDTQ